MTFDAVWVDAHPLCWDQATIDETLTAVGAAHHLGFGVDYAGSGAAVVIPARYHTGDVRLFNNLLGNLDWAVVFLTSDEETTFPPNAFHHPNLRLWTQTPRPGVHRPGDRYMGFGPPPDTAELLASCSRPDDDRPFDWFFAGQVNHKRRRQCVHTLGSLPGGKMVTTPGFTQGLPRGEYLALMAGSKVVPCPSGPQTPDSFRLWEALEAGCVPVADTVCPAYPATNYWQLMLNRDDVPFPTIGDWDQLPALLGGLLAGWPGNANRIQAWWQQYRHQQATRIVSDISDVSGVRLDTGGDITVLIPTSPIPAHPDTTLIEDTVVSVRHHLPQAKIVVMCDGVRAEQEHRRGDYDEYLRRLLWLCRHRWGNAVPMIFDDHQHQANMARRALIEQVSTPLVMFVEHDTPLVTDEPIDWQAVQAPLLADELDVVRFHHEAIILDVHRHLMVDGTPVDVAGCPVYRTMQWSQRPHLARADYYRFLLAEHFPPTGRTMIEDLAHGVCQRYPWRFNRLAIYAPGSNLKRSLHSDGRGDDPKYEMRFA